jgi:hypothetical protein
VLAALPALAGGLLPWAGGRIGEPFGARAPGVTLPSTRTPGPAPAGRDVAAGPAPAEVADPPAGGQPARGDNDTRDRDDDSSGPGRSGGGGGGSSGPG